MSKGHATKPWNNIVASDQVLGLGKIVRRHFSGAVVAGQHRPRRSAEVLLPIAAVAVGRSTRVGEVPRHCAGTEQYLIRFLHKLVWLIRQPTSKEHRYRK